MRNDVIHKTFEELLNKRCWNVRHRTVNLSFNLGNPFLKYEECKHDPQKDRKIRRYIDAYAEWFFWVYFGHWKLTAISVDGKKKLTATSSSTVKQKEQVCQLLQGQILNYVCIDHTTSKTILNFDLGAVLIIRRPSMITNEIWLLYKPNGYCLSIHGDGTYDYEKDNRQLIKNKPTAKEVAVGTRCPL